MFDDGEMVRVDKGDNEGNDGVSSIVFGVRIDYQFRSSERKFFLQLRPLPRFVTHRYHRQRRGLNPKRRLHSLRIPVRQVYIPERSYL